MVYLLWYVGSVPPVIRPVITRTGEPASPSGLYSSDLDQHAAGVEPEPGHLLACFVFLAILSAVLPCLAVWSRTVRGSSRHRTKMSPASWSTAILHAPGEGPS